MKSAEIEAIRARWASAPAGPWCDGVDGGDGVIRVWFGAAPNAVVSRDLTVACVIFPGDMETYETADFHAARALSQAPTDIAALLAEVDHLRKELAEGRETCPHCKEYTIPVVAPGDVEALARRLIDYAIAKFWEAAPHRAVRFRDRDGDEGYYFER